MPSQSALFGGPEREVPKPARPDELEVLITVKAAPNPSAKAGETVCVAGLGLSPGRTEVRWIRLYPINFRFLEQDQQFKKYDILRVRATPASGDTRVESWRPDMSTMKVIDHLDPWKRRRALLDPTASDTMCSLNRENQAEAVASSLGLVPVRELIDLRVTEHPGWSQNEQSDITCSTCSGSTTPSKRAPRARRSDGTSPRPVQSRAARHDDPVARRSVA